MAYTTFLSDSKTVIVTQEMHNGVDMQFQPIYYSNLFFPKAGTVSISQYGGAGDLWTYGEWYEIQCQDGTKYRMAHLKSRAAQAGATVEQGQFAGVQGNTGNTSGATGIHLHLEYFVGGSRVNPQPLMGFPAKLGTYDIAFGGGGSPEPPPPPPPFPDAIRVPRKFEFMAVQATEDTTVNTVNGEVIVQKGEWIIEPQNGVAEWQGYNAPRMNAYIIKEE